MQGRNLIQEPFRLLIYDDGDEVLEAVDVFVLAYRDGEVVAWGRIDSSPHPVFLRDEIVTLNVTLADALRDARISRDHGRHRHRRHPEQALGVGVRRFAGPTCADALRRRLRDPHPSQHRIAAPDQRGARS
ncbi:MAG: hypothetical protein ABI333_05450 [bacterium]